MAEQLELDTSTSQDSERERVLRDFGKDFRDGKSQSELGREGAQDRETADQGAAQDGNGADEGAQRDNRPRDEKTGKFAKKPEPFEGFSKLDPKIQEQYNALAKERDTYKSTANNYYAETGKVAGLQRELNALRAQIQKPNQTPQTQQRNQLKLDEMLKGEAWKQFESRYPEDAVGIKDALQTTVDGLVSRFSDSANPLAEEVNRLKARLGELDTREQMKAAQEVSDRLTQEHPEWREIAGWEVDGNYVADPSQRQWHPWFSAWRETLPVIMRQQYDQMLGSTDAESIGYVLSHFKRDVAAAQGQSGQSDGAPRDELSQRRADALRDTSPRPSRTGADAPSTLFDPSGNEDADRMAVLNRYYEKYRAGQRP